jgi:hypothetical protein
LTNEDIPLKLKRLFAVEIAVTIIALVGVLFYVEVSPYLISSKPGASIGMYNEREFASKVATLTRGQTARTQFNYSSFDPAIIVLDVSFQSFQTPGDLTVYCNARRIATLYVAPDNPQVRLNVITVSGADWVSTTSTSTYAYGNEITFTSSPQNGYAGTFEYKINIRGSR